MLATTPALVLSRPLIFEGGSANGADENRHYRHRQDFAGPASAGHRKKPGLPAHRRRQSARPDRPGRSHFQDADRALCDAARSRCGRNLHAAACKACNSQAGARGGQGRPLGEAAGGDGRRDARSRAGRRRAEEGHLRDLALAVQSSRRRSKKAARGPAPTLARDRLDGRRAALASRAGLGVGRGQFWRFRSRHQRALDPDEDHAGRDVREIGLAFLSRKPRYADCGLAGLFKQRRGR